MLQKLVNTLVKDSSAASERVCMALLGALIPIGRHMLRHSLRTTAGGESSRPVTPTFVPDLGFSTLNSGSGAADSTNAGAGGFPQLMVVMATLAGAGRSGKGHAVLFKAALEWTNLCKSRFGRGELAAVIRGSGGGGDEDDDDYDEDEEEEVEGPPVASRAKAGSSKACLEAICFLLSYVGEILGALKLTSVSATKTDSIDAEQQHEWAVPGMDSDLYYLMEGWGGMF